MLIIFAVYFRKRGEISAYCGVFLVIWVLIADVMLGSSLTIKIFQKGISYWFPEDYSSYGYFYINFLGMESFDEYPLITEWKIISFFMTLSFCVIIVGIILVVFGRIKQNRMDLRKVKNIYIIGYIVSVIGIISWFVSLYTRYDFAVEGFIPQEVYETFQLQSNRFFGIFQNDEYIVYWHLGTWPLIVLVSLIIGLIDSIALNPTKIELLKERSLQKIKYEEFTPDLVEEPRGHKDIAFPIKKTFLLMVPIMLIIMAVMIFVFSFFSIYTFFYMILFFPSLLVFTVLFILHSPGMIINENDITLHFLVCKKTYPINFFKIKSLTIKDKKIISFRIKNTKMRSLSYNIAFFFIPKELSYFSREINKKAVKAERIFYLLKSKLI